MNAALAPIEPELLVVGESTPPTVPRPPVWASILGSSWFVPAVVTLAVAHRAQKKGVKQDTVLLATSLTAVGSYIVWNKSIEALQKTLTV